MDSIFSHERNASWRSQGKYYCEPRRHRFVPAARLALHNDMEGSETLFGTGTVEMQRILVEELWQEPREFNNEAYLRLWCFHQHDVPSPRAVTKYVGTSKRFRTFLSVGYW
jgi:hypothetical protein